MKKLRKWTRAKEWRHLKGAYVSEKKNRKDRRIKGAASRLKKLKKRATT
jgi:hypothetical protein